MSLTSCFKYAIELREAALTDLLRSVISQGETATFQLTYEDDIVVGGYDAHISASLVDSDDEPSSFDLQADPEATLGLHMRIEVTLDEVDGLNAIVYRVGFDLPGEIGKQDVDATPTIVMTFPGVAPADLGLVIVDEDLSFTAALFEQAVHDLYAASPDLHEQTESGVVTPDGTMLVRTWIYDTTEAPILVEVPDPSTLRITFPGRMQMSDVSGPVYDFTFTLQVDVPLVIEPVVSGARQLVVKLSQVTAADMTVTRGPGSAPLWYDGIPGVDSVPMRITNAFLAQLATMTDPSEEIPSDAQIRTQMEIALAAYAAGLLLPLLPLQEDLGGEIAIDTAIPQIVGDVLVLKIEDEPDPSVPCDDPIDFTGGDPLAIAIGGAEANRRLEAAEDDIEGQTIPGEIDVTMNRPNMSLADGHIAVSGSGTAHVGGCVGDVGFNYSGKLTLSLAPSVSGGVEIIATPTDFDDDVDKKKAPDDVNEQVEAFMATQDLGFPTLPTTFAGVGDITVDLTTITVRTDGIVISGGLTIQTLNAQLLGQILPRSAYWASEAAGG